MLFKELDIIEPILKALEIQWYEKATPIQEKAIPLILKKRDVIWCAQTWTWKTAAFAIPTIQLLYNNKSTSKERLIKTLILTPTRELAIQIEENFIAYSKFTNLKNTVIFGWVNQWKQTNKLKEWVDILVATPGRLLDLMNQWFVNLKHIEIFILDEADRMLNMGFINDVKKVIAKIPTNRQSLFFSATMPDEIRELADSILKNPIKVEVTPESSTVDKINQNILFVSKNDKKNLLHYLLQDKEIKSALVFTRTKHWADKVVKELASNNIIAEAIHGNKSQNARQRALNNFKSWETRVLIATDIAARWIDIDELGHVFNYDLPNEPETYVHRIGRTWRAWLDGKAYSFCNEEEKEYLIDIQNLIKKTIPVIDEHPYPLSSWNSLDIDVKKKKPKQKNRTSNNRNNTWFKREGKRNMRKK